MAEIDVQELEPLTEEELAGVKEAIRRIDAGNVLAREIADEVIHRVATAEMPERVRVFTLRMVARELTEFADGNG